MNPLGSKTLSIVIRGASICFFFLVYFTNINAAIIESGITGNWNVGATWVGGVVPAATDDVVIKASHVVTVTNNETIVNVEVESTGELIVNATFTLICDGDILQNGIITVNGTLTNTGNITQVGIITVNGTLTNTGNILQDGTITIATGGIFNHANNTTNTITQNGTFNVNGTLNLNGGTYVINMVNSFSGGGVLNLENYNSFGPNVEWRPFIPVINFSANSDANWDGNIIFFLQNGTDFNFYDGGGQIALSSGFSSQGTFNIEGPGLHRLNSDFENQKTVNWNAGDLEGNKVFTNTSTFNALDAPSYFNMAIINVYPGEIFGGGVFGSLITNNIDAEITLPFDKTMTVNDVNCASKFQIDGTLNLVGGQIDISNSNCFSGIGTINVAGNISMVSSVEWKPAISTINFNSGSIAGSDLAIVFPVITTVNYYTSGLQLGGSGSIENKGTFNIEGTSSIIGSFTNYQGIVNLEAGDFSIIGGDFYNANLGQFNLNGGNSFSGTIFNEADINCNVNCNFVSPINNISGGTVDVKADKVLQIQSLNNDLDAILKGNGTIDALNGVAGDGSVQPGASPGTLNIIGNYTPGTLVAELWESGGNVTKDSIHVTGNVNLSSGTLNILTQGILPAGSYTILKCTGALTGVFTTVTGDPCVTVEYGSDFIILKVGVTKTWNGLNDVWSNASEWTPFGVPCIEDDVIINAGIVTLDIQPEMKSLTVNGGQVNNTSGSFSISAPTIFAIGTKCVVNQPLAFTGILDNNGKIQGISTIDISAATMVGGYGIWAPGNSAGDLTATGVYDNEIIEMEIKGPTNGSGNVEHDILEVSDDMKVSGKIEISWIGGTVPPATRTIMECDGGPGCRTQQFSTIILPIQCNGGCSIEYTDTQVRLRNDVPIEFIGTCIWQGGNSDWNTITNWSCNDVPNANDDVEINGGSVSVNVPVSVKSLKLTGGTLTGSNALTVLNALNWSGGTLGLTQPVTVGLANISGITTLGIGASLVLSQGGVLENPSITLENNSNLILSTNKSLEISQGTINSNAGTGAFINNGTLLKSGTGQFNFNSNLTNAGTLTANAGIFKILKNLTNNGLIKGAGILNLEQAGTVSMGNVNPGNSPGLLTIAGNYTNKNLIIEFLESGGVTTHDELEVTQTITLAGVDNDLVIDNIGGGTVPYGVYEFLYCNGTLPCRTGTFDEITYPAFCTGAECNLIYTDDGVKLNFQAALPVELSGWFGYKKDNAIILNWTTESEVNTEKFTVQRLHQSIWENISSTNAKGTPSMTSSYSLMDQFPQLGSNLYRLEMIDLDGQKMYSPIVAVSFDTQDDWKIYPNPANDYITIQTGNQKNGVYLLVNATGQVLVQQEFSQGEEMNISLSKLPKGIYCICFLGNSCKTFVKK